MILLKPDHDRRIEIPGVPRPVRRPVDIDRSLTNFSVLRTLRIYRFEKDSVIEGHAEEDEVFIVVLSGSIELTMSVDPLEKGSPVILAAPDGSGAVACAAYLPRHAAYTLIPQTDADIAYARASPASDRMPKVFSSRPRPDSSGVHLLLDEKTHAERLLLRLLCISSQANEAFHVPVEEYVGECEGLMHIRMTSPEQMEAAMNGGEKGPVTICSFDTIVASPGDRLTLNFAAGSAGLALIVMAR